MISNPYQQPFALKKPRQSMGMRSLSIRRKGEASKQSPGTLYLHSGHKMSFSSGILISPEYVLTCAHNLVNASYILFQNAGEEIPVQTVVFLRGYNPREAAKDHRNDFALLKLASKASLGVPLPMVSLDLDNKGDHVPINLMGYSGNNRQDLTCIGAFKEFCNPGELSYRTEKEIPRGLKGAGLVSRIGGEDRLVGIHIDIKGGSEGKLGKGFALTSDIITMINAWLEILANDIPG